MTRPNRLDPDSNRLMKRSEVLQHVPHSPKTWERYVKAGWAPAPLRSPTGSVFWREKDIAAYINQFPNYSKS